MKSKVYIVAAITAWAAGCATGPTSPPVIEESTPIEREPVQSPAGTEIGERPQTTAATASLLAAAAGATAADDFSGAIAYLERAVRIDPRNARLWIELSAAHLADQNFTAATQHARKAIALAGQDAGLTRSAWLQLADIREAQGNGSEANAIRRRYGSARG